MTVALHSTFLNIHQMVTEMFSCRHGWCQVKTAYLGACSVYTLQLCTNLQCHFIQTHIHMVHVCLAVTFHLYFWLNDQDLLHATAVTQGWNGYWNNNQQRKLAWRRKFSHRSCQDSNPRPFDQEYGALPLSYPHSPRSSPGLSCITHSRDQVAHAGQAGASGVEESSLVWWQLQGRQPPCSRGTQIQHTQQFTLEFQKKNGIMHTNMFSTDGASSNLDFWKGRYQKLQTHHSKALVRHKKFFNFLL